MNTGPYSLIGAIRPFLGDTITSFDISFVDPVRKRYFLANRTSKNIIVVDTTTNVIVGNFKPGFAGAVGTPVNNNISGPDGVLTTETELYVGDAPSQVWALEPGSGAPVLPPIKTSLTSPNRADEGCYDPTHKLVAFVNNADDIPFITFISTATHSIVAQIFFDGTGGTPLATDGAEQCAWNPRNGLFYLSIPEVNGAGDNSSPGAVITIDPDTFAVTHIFTIPLAACTGPQGLAIGPAPLIGLGCNLNPTAANNAIINDSGSVVHSFPNQGGADEAWYSPGNNKFFVAARQAPGGEALFIIDAATFAVQRLFTGTASNAHSVAVDPFTNVAYVPTSSAATSHLCSSQGAVDAEGCILLFGPAGSGGTPPPSCSLASEFGDLNGDKKDDIVFRRTSDGLTSAFLMNGFSILSTNVIGVVDPAFTFVAVADFNGDGNADLLFRRNSDGMLAMYLMNGANVVSASFVGAVATDFEFVGASDFNGDGKADILFRRRGDGMFSLLLMNGANVVSASFLGAIGNEWRVRGVRDVNGDGKADIVLRRTTDGNLAVYEFNGFENIGAALLGSAGTAFDIVGVRDFDGDARADLLMRRASDGMLAIYLLNGFTVKAAQLIGAVGPEFSVLGLGDFNGDGRSDIMFRRTSDGMLSEMQMNGFTILGAQFLGAVGTEFLACYGQPPLSVVSAQ